ncbi:hypothetical protein [Methylomonas koyamae]|nr:hypothetical protein [Methylomonas koyamae]ATG88685.1 hypothetical protein MKLM6_0406 [Methylomonas koyamae]
MKVFLDSNIIQHAATTYRTMDIHFGGAKSGEPLVRTGPVTTITKKPANSKNLRDEIECLPELSIKLKEIGATLITDFENIYSEVRKAGRFRKEYFFGSDVSYAEPPPEFNTIFGMPSWLNPGHTDKHFHNFLHNLKNSRFLELAKYAGALQGKEPNYNQLADAYFLWCAEVNRADYFLTLDSRLERSINQAKSLVFEPRVISASKLLSEIKNA